MSGMFIFLLIVIVGIAAFLFRPRKEAQAVRSRRSSSNKKRKVRDNKHISALKEDDFDDEPDSSAALMPEKQVVSEQNINPGDDDIISVRYNVNGYKKNTGEAQAPAVASSATVAFYLLADKALPYQGYDLLQALLSAGLRFGSKQIFHYYENRKISGREIFSCASIEKPGTFDIQHMGGTTCKGLVLFLKVQQSSKQSLSDFEFLLDTLRVLHETLGGEVCDQAGTPVTQKMLNATREFIDASSNVKEHTCVTD